jgi:hypothetical protein
MICMMLPVPGSLLPRVGNCALPSETLSTKPIAPVQALRGTLSWPFTGTEVLKIAAQIPVSAPRLVP